MGGCIWSENPIPKNTWHFWSVTYSKLGRMEGEENCRNLSAPDFCVPSTSSANTFWGDFWRWSDGQFHHKLWLNKNHWFPIWVFPKIVVFPQNGWFIMENPIKHGMIWEVLPLFFGKHPYDWTYDDFPSCGSMSSVPTLVTLIGYPPTKYITHVKPVIFGEPENLVQDDLGLPPATKKRPVSPEGLSFSNHCGLSSSAQRVVDARRRWWIWRPRVKRKSIAARNYLPLQVM